ncbi:hypothetical protein GUJ93_ZPchr0006g46386 [Zizania palustris]|uniref:Uncharacterized protein n=1 Tax=Zizania palustris TaxID=103762 RepID=A0A8J5T5Y6_ZIZPA|nr:hypothetical protein GUJ93_ZPchr0006g46386 [Zizania palustris]
MGGSAPGDGEGGLCSRWWLGLREVGAPCGGGSEQWSSGRRGSKRQGSRWRGLRAAWLREAGAAQASMTRCSSLGGGGFKMRGLRMEGLRAEGASGGDRASAGNGCSRRAGFERWGATEGVNLSGKNIIYTFYVFFLLYLLNCVTRD